MKFGTIVTALGLALTCVTAGAQSVTYDYDKAADFSRIKTYAWTTGSALADQFNHQRIVSAIETQLSAKGLTKVEAGANPDVLVAYHASFDRNLEINGFESGWGGPRLGASRSGSARVEQIVTGTLVVDIIQASSKSMLWRGIATKEIDAQAKPEERDKKANKAAEKLFKKYPPQKAE
jgi:hypothetical protein